MDTRDLLTLPPAPDRIRRTLLAVGELLDLDRCWLYQRRYHFSIADGWTIAVKPESAGRLRIEACHWTRPASTLWTLAEDEDRLAGAVLELRERIDGVHQGV